jgi:hypothetical protein
MTARRPSAIRGLLDRDVGVGDRDIDGALFQEVATFGSPSALKGDASAYGQVYAPDRRLLPKA